MRLIPLLFLLSCGSPMMQANCVDTCHDGCCHNGMCMPGTSDLSCGKYGLGCVDCLGQGLTCDATRNCTSGTGGGSAAGGGQGGGGSHDDGGSQFILATLKYKYMPDVQWSCPDAPEPQVCSISIGMTASRFGQIPGHYAGCPVESPATGQRVIDCAVMVGSCTNMSAECMDGGLNAVISWQCYRPEFTPYRDCDWTPP